MPKKFFILSTTPPKNPLIFSLSHSPASEMPFHSPVIRFFPTLHAVEEKVPNPMYVERIISEFFCHELWDWL